MGTHKKVEWVCEEGHEWEARVSSRSSGNGCPHCYNNSGAVYLIAQHFLTRAGIEAIKVGIVNKSKKRNAHESCKRRLTDIKGCNAQRVEILRVYLGGTFKHEQAIHAALDDIRANGEWFIVDGDEEVLKRIKRVCARIIHGIDLVESDANTQLSLLDYA